MTRDPFPGIAALPSTQNAYVYGLNNPANLTDPSGRIAPLVAAGIAAGVGAAIGGTAAGLEYVTAHPGQRPEDYLQDAGFRQAVGVGALSGGVAGAVGFFAAGVAFGGGFGGAMASGIFSGALSGVFGQVTTNLAMGCPWHRGVLEAGVSGGLIEWVTGGLGYGIGQLAKGRSLPLQLHHYATNKNTVYTPRFNRIVQRYDLGLDESWNKDLLPHLGRHPNEYHDFVLSGMQKAAQEAGNDTSKFLNLSTDM
jgi:hypothetical protein